MKLPRIADLRLAALVLGVVALAAWMPAGAQSPLDYGKLLGGDGAPEPLHSVPVGPLPTPDAAGPGAGATGGPTAADYDRIAASAADPMLDETRQAVALFRARVRSTVSRLPEAWDKIQTALAAASPTGEPSYFLGVAIFAGLLLLIGRAVMIILMVYVARRILVAMQRRDRQGYLGKLPLLAVRFLVTVFGVALTLTVATAVGLVLYQEHEATLITVIVVFAAYAAVLTVDTVWRMALAPYLSEYRLPAIGDAAARSLYRWLSAVSAFGILTMAFAYWMQALGLSAEVHTALIVSLSFVALVLLLAMLRSHRRTISGAILAGRRREEASWITLASVTLWGPAVALYLLVTWGDMSFRLVMGIATSPLRLAVPYVILMAGLIVYAISSYLIERVFTRSREIKAINAELDARRREEEAAEVRRIRDLAAEVTAESDGDEDGGGVVAPARRGVFASRRQSMQTLEDLARRIASIFAVGAVVYALIRFWGGPGVFERVPGLGLAADLVDNLVIGYIIYHTVRIWIDRKIEEEVGDEVPATPGEGEGGGAGATRLATLLPLFRNFLLIVIVVAVILLVAVELGVNVAPLFAGAGVVGLAIGFGSQALVRDILSGAFFLMDDAFRKGEYVDVGEVKGTVERISLRSFQLRHHLGMLHTIPFGEIQHLTNFSRDWVMMKLPLRVTYDTDVEKVRKLIKKLGLALLDDPEIGHKFLQPLKSQGVIQMDDSAMILRVKFMCLPGEQWVLRKRIFAELRELFEREGIKFAHREVTVHIPDLDEKRGELSEEQVRAIGAAARRVGDQVEEEALAAGGAGDVR